MAISTQDWGEIEQRLAQEGADVADLRRQYPHLSWIRCDAADMNETPYRTYSDFDIHLIDSRDHCVRITTEAAQATGLIVANKAVAL